MRIARRCARPCLTLILLGACVLPLGGCVAAWPLLLARQIL